MSTVRSIRRAAERQAAKLVRKQQPFPAEASAFTAGAAVIAPASIPLSAPPPATNRSTGPRTTEGKAVSCLNRLKHGLTGAFRVLEFESQSQFNELADTLRSEHAPVTATETILVDRIAEHIWLSQRAQRLQDDALFENNEQALALYLRYQATNDRGFHRCLRELRTVRRERQQQEQFESHNYVSALVVPQPAPAPSVQSSAAPTCQAVLAAEANSSNRKTVAGPVLTSVANDLEFEPLADFMPNGRYHRAALASLVLP